MTRHAVIAIGSNSIRLLVADADYSLSNSFRARRESRLFMKMEEGKLTAGGLNEALEAVKAMKDIAKKQDAIRIDLIATSAVRDAGNSIILVDSIKAETGLILNILTGKEEASYSFLGAAGTGLTGVLDIGGGSTEIVIGENLQIFASVSAQAGASRLYLEKPINSENDIHGAMSKARSQLEASTASLNNVLKPNHWKVTGGTGTTMAAVIQGVPLENANPEGFVANIRNIRDCLFRVAGIPASERSGVTGLPKSRTDIFPTGLCLLVAAMELIDIEKIVVTTRGNTDGWLRSIVCKLFP